ncbi:uncharacterized protein PSFLO_05082 [Pseudozyma flocculosa]|uniref:Uncharacterized protein n=1 Tax=Pseudozyma flocculosa TaxID=84751 RepID=A0A5C3F8C9_9BASI|nr:uncharacterized protein PSFLO_05082 [Pseudozyma flocculosa]
MLGQVSRRRWPARVGRGWTREVGRRERGKAVRRPQGRADRRSGGRADGRAVGRPSGLGSSVQADRGAGQRQGESANQPTATQLLSFKLSGGVGGGNGGGERSGQARPGCAMEGGRTGRPARQGRRGRRGGVPKVLGEDERARERESAAEDEEGARERREEREAETGAHGQGEDTGAGLQPCQPKPHAWRARGGQTKRGRRGNTGQTPPACLLSLWAARAAMQPSVQPAERADLAGLGPAGVRAHDGRTSAGWSQVWPDGGAMPAIGLIEAVIGDQSGCSACRRPHPACLQSVLLQPVSSRDGYRMQARVALATKRG